MQSRIFSVGGKPFVAVRDGFVETYGTLAALIGKHPAAASNRSTEVGFAPIPAQGAPSDMETSATVLDVPEGIGAQQDDTGAPSDKPRKVRAPRPKLRSAPTQGAVATAKKAEVPKADRTTAELGAAPARAPRARVAGRKTGEPPTPSCSVPGCGVWV